MGILVAFVMGMLLAAIYEWRKTLVSTIFVHGMYNAIAMASVAAAILASAKAPAIGVSFRPDATTQAVVDKVVPGSPAEQAGIRPSDVIVSYDGREITDGKQLAGLVRAGKVGDTVSLKIVRGDRPMTLRLVLRSRADLE